MDEQELREAVAELVDDWYTGEVASRVSVAPDARDDLKERIAGFVRGEQAEVERLRVELERARAEERERCALVCEKRAAMWEEVATKPASYPVALHDAKAAEAWSCGADIRAME